MASLAFADNIKSSGSRVGAAFSFSFPTRVHRKAEPLKERVRTLEACFRQPAELVGQRSAAVEGHAFLRRADLVRGTAQGAGAVQVHVFVESLVPGRRPEDLLRVDEESAGGEDGVNAREQVALVRVAEVMDGQRRDDRIERTRGQRVREFLDVQGGLEWR